MKAPPPTAYPVSIAPMMQRTDRHYRYLMRRITRHTLLYTEMLTTGAIIHGDRQRLLGFHDDEHPLVLQIGGSDPDELAEAARIGQSFGYDEINLNVGCPSSRVQNARIGACLMESPEVVARAVEAMRQAVDVEVTVKHRIGVDEVDSYDHMLDFVDTVADAGCRRFIVHARKAWLQGLSPAENRNVPPLRHHEIHRLKDERPELIIETNGGIDSYDEIDAHLEYVDGVMIGRAAYDDPWLFSEVDRRYFGDDHPIPTRHEVVEGLFDYVRYWTEERGARLHHISRHLLQIFRAQPGARAWRRHISNNACDRDAGVDVLREGLDLISEINSPAA